MSLRHEFEQRESFFGANALTSFYLKHAVKYEIGPDTFNCEKGEPQQCYMNACHLAHDNPLLTYVEGKVAVFGIGIDHAWCVDENGVVVEPTLVNNDDGRILEYWGMPFNTEYVRRAALANGIYGLLDYFYADKTAPKLYELGLEEGQQWLLAMPRSAIRLLRKRRAKRNAA